MPAPTKRVERECGVCGKTLYILPSRLKRGDGKYCSKKCWGMAQRTRVENKCLVCGKKFLVPPCKKKDGTGKYCSIQCKAKSQELKTSRICKTCGSVFLIRPCMGKDKKGVFCSPECRMEWFKGKNHACWSQVWQVCKMCGKNYTVKKGRIGDNKKSFCSNECKGQWFSRENNPSWDKNRTDFERINQRNIKGYKKWRKLVFKKDNFTCQKCCDSKGGNLNAHHIESYNNNVELRTSVENGVTLCENCHFDFHHQYGFGNNTKSQLLEFISVSKEKISA